MGWALMKDCTSRQLPTADWGWFIIFFHAKNAVEQMPAFKEAATKKGVSGSGDRVPVQ
jgi:hypothetical protein